MGPIAPIAIILLLSAACGGLLARRRGEAPEGIALSAARWAIVVGMLAVVAAILYDRLG